MATRFNPTTNGSLHLGHLYLMLLNRQAALDRGEPWIVRFDDDQPYWLNRLGAAQIEAFKEEIREDLAWMGLEADLYSSERGERDANESFLKEHGWNGNLPDRSQEGEFQIPQITSCERPYPYVPYLTAVKVAQDSRENCTLIIRGDDLVTEFSLYCWFCEQLKLPIPQFQFVPKLISNEADLSDVSKTSGNFKIRDFRQRGYTPGDLQQLLAQSCLIHEATGWTYGNIKRQPQLT